MLKLQGICSFLSVLSIPFLLLFSHSEPCRLVCTLKCLHSDSSTTSFFRLSFTVQPVSFHPIFCCLLSLGFSWILSVFLRWLSYCTAFLSPRQILLAIFCLLCTPSLMHEPIEGTLPHLYIPYFSQWLLGLTSSSDSHLFFHYRSLLSSWTFCHAQAASSSYHLLFCNHQLSLPRLPINSGLYLPLGCFFFHLSSSIIVTSLFPFHLAGSTEVMVPPMFPFNLSSSVSLSPR